MGAIAFLAVEVVVLFAARCGGFPRRHCFQGSELDAFSAEGGILVCCYIGVWGRCPRSRQTK